MKNLCYLYFFLLLYSSCSNNQCIRNENPKHGLLKSNYALCKTSEKRFALDEATAPKPVFVQTMQMEGQSPILSFLNQYNNSIYFYDFNSSELKDVIIYTELLQNNSKIGGYYFINKDSLYVYDASKVQLYLLNINNGAKDVIYLHDGDKNWPLFYPQYMLSTVNPMIRYEDTLVLIGQHFPSIPSSSIMNFRFACLINMHTGETRFQNIYPEELYGYDSNWEGGLATAVYPCMTETGSLIYSFPVSHDLYLTSLTEEKYMKMYGGSNVAKTISSINYKEAHTTPNDLILKNYLEQDMYTAIIFDQFRNIYYRFCLNSIDPNETSLTKDDKYLSVVILDNSFNYLGETSIGTCKDWNWKNSFVSKTGLNIEYTDNMDEDNLVFVEFKLVEI